MSLCFRLPARDKFALCRHLHNRQASATDHRCEVTLPSPDGYEQPGKRVGGRE